MELIPTYVLAYIFPVDIASGNFVRFGFSFLYLSSKFQHPGIPETINFFETKRGGRVTRKGRRFVHLINNNEKRMFFAKWFLNARGTLYYFRVPNAWRNESTFLSNLKTSKNVYLTRSNAKTENEEFTIFIKSKKKKNRFQFLTLAAGNCFVRAQNH